MIDQEPQAKNPSLQRRTVLGYKENQGCGCQNVAETIRGIYSEQSQAGLFDIASLNSPLMQAARERQGQSSSETPLLVKVRRDTPDSPEIIERVSRPGIGMVRDLLTLGSPAQALRTGYVGLNAWLNDARAEQGKARNQGSGRDDVVSPKPSLTETINNKRRTTLLSLAASTVGLIGAALPIEVPRLASPSIAFADPVLNPRFKAELDQRAADFIKMRNESQAVVRREDMTQREVERFVERAKHDINVAALTSFFDTQPEMKQRAAAALASGTQKAALAAEGFVLTGNYRDMTRGGERKDINLKIAYMPHLVPGARVTYIEDPGTFKAAYGLILSEGATNMDNMEIFLNNGNVVEPSAAGLYLARKLNPNKSTMSLSNSAEADCSIPGCAALVLMCAGTAACCVVERNCCAPGMGICAGAAVACAPCWPQ